jgi:hypothetical protein
MLITDILCEHATAPLYHGTSWTNAVDILDDGGFLPMTAHPIQGKVMRGISTSRSPRLSHLDYNPAKHGYEPAKITAFNVIFVLNQAAIADQFRIYPVDYFKGNKTISVFDREASALSDRRAESEEFIVIPKNKKLPLKGNVLKIIFYSGSYANPDDEPPLDDFLAFRAKALRYSIPVIFNRTLYQYSDYKRDWTQNDRASMITHAEKNELRLGDREYGDLMALRQRYIAAGQPTDETAWMMFDAGEQFALGTFWQSLNGRNFRPGQVLTPMTVRAIFNILGRVDPRTKIAYRKIAPFRPVNPEPLPPRHNGGVRTRQNA